MGERTPTMSEIETAATTYIWQLAQESPDEYPEAPEFTDYLEVCAAFRRWLAAHNAGIWDEGEEAGRHNERVWVEDDETTNPYRNA